MHSGLRLLADKFQIPLSERSCYRSFIYDGETIALNFQQEKWDEDEYALVSISSPQRIPDNILAHEMAHWLVASPEERKFPEYGCNMGLVNDAFGFHSLPLERAWVHIRKKDWDVAVKWNENVLLHEEQEFREFCADFLGTYWCQQVGIPVPPNTLPSFKYNNNPLAWQAIIWLHDSSLL